MDAGDYTTIYLFMYKCVNLNLIFFIRIHGHLGSNCPLLPASVNEWTRNYMQQPYRHNIAKFQRQKEELIHLGLEVDVMWECEWDKLYRSGNSLLRRLKEQHFFARPNDRLIPRTALRGGRVDAFSFYWSQQFKKDENFFYCDYNSL